MRSFLFLVAIVALSYGLWIHDWTTIIAAFTLAIIWPLIERDIDVRSERALLDRLWDDDDLKDSA